jgi:hypothetical protein
MGTCVELIARRRPSVFVVGAPKCGTTALYEYLRTHPNLFLPAKEQHFFGSDLYPPERPHDEAAYLQPFASAPVEAQLGEASVWYLYSRRAAQEIKQFSPGAKIIVCLRNPVDMIHSLHSHFTWSGIEDVQPFERAIETEMKTGRSLPVWSRHGVTTPIHYLAAGAYHEQVQRYVTAFGRDQVKVVILDDLERNAQSHYHDVCEFLAIDSNAARPVGVVNAHRGLKSVPLQRLVWRPPTALRAALRLVTSRRHRQAISSRLLRLNTTHAARPAMQTSMKRQLQAHFAGDVERLSTLLGRDLTHWNRS